MLAQGRISSPSVAGLSSAQGRPLGVLLRSVIFRLLTVLSLDVGESSLDTEPSIGASSSDDGHTCTRRHCDGNSYSL